MQQPANEEEHPRVPARPADAGAAGPASRTNEPTVRTLPWGGAGRLLASVVGVVLVVAALRIARPVMLPLVLGLFLAVLARPLHLRLRGWMPRGLRWLGLVLTMLVMLATLGAFAAAIGWSGRAIVQELQTRRPEIERRLEPLRGRAAALGIELPGGGTQARGAQTGGARPAAGQPAPGGAAADSTSGGGGQSTPARALRTVLSTFGMLGLALAFAALGLAEADDARRRIERLERGHGGHGALDAIDEAAPAFRRYVWVKSLTSAITGTATALAALAFGLPLAWVWGFIAFLFEYVPTVGSVLAVLPPTLMALAEGGAGRALAVLLTVGTLQVILGNVVDPRLEGRLMSVSPFGVLLSIVFWGWLWGAVGALLAVPLTVAVVIACRHVPGWEGVATLVAGDGVDDGKEEKGARAAG